MGDCSVVCSPKCQNRKILSMLKNPRKKRKIFDRLKPAAKRGVSRVK